MEIKRVLFIGSKRAGLECVKKMYEIAPDKLIGVMTTNDSEDTRSEFNSFIQFSDKVPAVVARSKEDSEVIIQTLKPELCIVSGWYWIFSKEILQSVPHGFIGFHNSLLPTYRGGAPLVWQIINGESHAAVSMFSFTEEMDEGNIWAVKGFHIMKDDTIDDCSKNASAIAIDLLEEHYLDILEGKTESFQQMGVPSYCAMRSPADGLIDWRKPSDSIYNFIRAQTHPYPGAFSHNEILGKVTVWESKPVDVTYYGVAGKVVKSIKDIGVYVICGDNKPLLITKVQQYDELETTADKLLSVGSRLI